MGREGTLGSDGKEEKTSADTITAELWPWG